MFVQFSRTDSHNDKAYTADFRSRVHMLDPLLGGLAWLGQFSDPLAWVVLAAFAAGAALDLRSRPAARYVTVGAWVLFGVFWLSLVHQFAFEAKSIVEGVGSAAAVPASFYVGYLLYRGRDSLLVLSRGVAVMGLLYLPTQAVAPVRQVLIEEVTDQTAFLMTLLGVDPTVVSGMTYQGVTIGGKVHPYESTFVFNEEGHTILYTIRIACTGLGSMAIIGGLVAGVRAPLRRKLRALAVSLPIIYVLNLFRNVFIGLSFGQQRAHVLPDLVMTLFGTSDPYMVSYYVADRIVAQFASVLALVVITWLVVREVPEVLSVVEDVLYVFTGTEYDLAAALDLDADAAADQPVRADGEG